jgi:hypothetical protein
MAAVLIGPTTKQQQQPLNNNDDINNNNNNDKNKKNGNNLFLISYTNSKFLLLGRYSVLQTLRFTDYQLRRI